MSHVSQLEDGSLFMKVARLRDATRDKPLFYKTIVVFTNFSNYLRLDKFILFIFDTTINLTMTYYGFRGFKKMQLKPTLGTARRGT